MRCSSASKYARQRTVLIDWTRTWIMPQRKGQQPVRRLGFARGRFHECHMRIQFGKGLPGGVV